jgi:hypothetical protein
MRRSLTKYREALGERYRVSNQVAMTSAIMITSTRVTRDFGSVFTGRRSARCGGPVATPG